MSRAVILSGVRTAIGGFGGSLKDVAVTELGRIVIEAAIERAKVEGSEIQEVILGNVLQAGNGMNSARQAATLAGLPESVPSFVINKVCGSGLKTVALAAQAIIAGDAELIVAGGMESMSRAPYLLKDARWGYRMGNGEIVDYMVSEGLTCALAHCHMGMTAENLAVKYGISRQAQDEFSTESQRRAVAAVKGGKFADEIIPVMLPQKRGEPVSFVEDEHPRAGTTNESLAKLRPAFLKENGTVTAGNASGINDGAAALVIASQDYARQNGLQPLATIVAYASAGVDPKIMGIGPVPAIKRALEKSALGLADIDLFELNEAFAAQSLAVVNELKIDPSKVNVNGGAIALGHPIGASGARILVTLLYEMQKKNAKRGLAALCIGGGQGIAMIVER